MAKIITITNLSRHPLSFNVSPDPKSTLFTPSGMVTLLAGKTIKVELKRVSESLLTRFKELGYIKFNISKIEATPVIVASQTVVVEFVLPSSTVGGNIPRTHDVAVRIVTSDGENLASEVQVTYDDTGGGTAVPATDYTDITPTVLTFIAGSADGATQNAQVGVLGANNPNRTVILELSSPSGATLGASSHTVTILNVSD